MSSSVCLLFQSSLLFQTTANCKS